MFSNILAKVREVWRRGFGRRKTRGVRQSEQSHSADPPVEPSPPRLPLELLFLVGDLVLSDAKNEDETEAAARQLCAVDRGFHERYGRRRQPRTVAVKGRAEVLSLTKRARADPAFARAVECVFLTEDEDVYQLDRSIQTIKRELPALHSFRLQAGSGLLELSAESFQTLLRSLEGFLNVDLGDIFVSSPPFSSARLSLPPSVRYLFLGEDSVRPLPLTIATFAPEPRNLVVLDLVWIAGFALNPSLPPILCQILLASLNSLKALQIYAPGDDDQVPRFLNGLTFPRLQVLHAFAGSLPISLLSPRLTHVTLTAYADRALGPSSLPSQCRHRLDSLLDDDLQRPGLRSWGAWYETEEPRRAWAPVTDRLIERGVRVQVETAGRSWEKLPTFADEVRASFGLDIPEWS